MHNSRIRNHYVVVIFSKQPIQFIRRHALDRTFDATIKLAVIWFDPTLSFAGILSHEHG